MAVLAEQLVEEWLHLAGFFTLRGSTVGVRDLLAVRRQAGGAAQGWHLQVHVTIRPTTYFGRLSAQEQAAIGARTPTSLTPPRPLHILQAGAGRWIEAEYHSERKRHMRERRWPGVGWQFKMVHGKVHEPAELNFIGASGVELIPFERVIKDLCERRPDRSSRSYLDAIEIIRYFGDHADGDLPEEPRLI